MTNKSGIKGLCKSCHECIGTCLAGQKIAHVVEHRLLRTFVLARPYCYICFRVCVSVLHQLDIDIPALDADWSITDELLASIDERHTTIHLAFQKRHDQLQLNATFFREESKEILNREKSIPCLQAICSLHIKSSSRNPPQAELIRSEFKYPLNTTRINLIRRWLATCKSSHRECESQRRPAHELAHENFFPDRLIEIGLGASTLRLVCRDTSKIPSCPPYATLSHCWGGESFLVLKRANLSTLQARIPGSELSRTFHEAIAFCRALRIGYLWIDSLCIVQDSEADWERQSSLMLVIYSRSVLNIAASASSSGSHGLFRSRPGALAGPMSFGLEDWQLSESSISFKSFMTQDDATTRGPLNRRAWVLQELALAPRIVHFTALGIILECFEGIGGESTTSDLKLLEDFLLAPDPARDRYSQIKFSRCRTVRDLDKQWDLVIKDYSRTRITFAKDRVVALAGLAERFYSEYLHMGCNTKYLLGCWSHRLYYDLLWHRFSGDYYNMKPYDDEALTTPTWSWFSARMPIKDGMLHRGDWDLDATIKFIYVDLHLTIPSMPFGPVNNAEILIRAKCGVVDAPIAILKLEQDLGKIKHVTLSGMDFKILLDHWHGLAETSKELEIIFILCHKDGYSFRGIICVSLVNNSIKSRRAPSVRRCGEFDAWEGVLARRPHLFEKECEYWLC